MCLNVLIVKRACETIASFVYRIQHLKGFFCRRFSTFIESEQAENAQH